MPYAVVLAWTLVSAQAAAAAPVNGAPARGVQVFTRHVDQMTGKPGHPAGVLGQDSPIPFRWNDRVYFLFGDTVFDDGRLFHPNSLAYTTDLDASDGLDLTYHSDNRHQAALRRVPGEFSVWFAGAYVLNDAVYASYNRIETVAPIVSGPYGVATLRSPDGRFEYIEGAELRGSPDPDPLRNEIGGSSFVDGGFVYKVSWVRSYLSSNARLSRAPIETHLDFSTYRFWTGTEWSSDPLADAPLFMNSAGVSIGWNEYLGKWQATGNAIYTRGFSSGIQIHLADELTGPWERLPVTDAFDFWPGEIFSTYNAKSHEAFNKEDGRIFYTFGTRQSTYNVNIFETHIDYAEWEWKPEAESDDFVSALRRQQKTELAFRLKGTSFWGAGEFERAHLVLHLMNRSKKDREIEIRVDLGVPNSPTFVDSGTHTEQAADVAGRIRIASVDIPVTVSAGADEIVIGGDQLRDVVNTARLHPGWIEHGFANYLPLFISRLDDLAWSPMVGRVEHGTPATLTTCHGYCENAS